MNYPWRPASGEIPTAAGVYRYWDNQNRVLYVGKAKNLRNRLNSYFTDPKGLHPRTRKMLRRAVKVDWVVVGNELEALQLEHTWISEYEPPFNVRFRDDKSYPWLAITYGDVFPRPLVVRGKRRKGWKYFGPFPQAWALRDSIDRLLKLYPVRTCNDSLLRQAQVSKRPCLLAHIGKCSAPCSGNISQADYLDLLGKFVGVFEGKSRDIQKSLLAEMTAASSAMEYERAAVLRDQLTALEAVSQHTKIVLSQGVDLDLVGLACDELAACVQVFHVRDGLLVGQRSFTTDRPEDSDEGEMISDALRAVYLEAEAIPPSEVLISHSSSNASTDLMWLQTLGPVRELKVPQRGEKAALMDTLRVNAAQALNLYRSRRGSDLAARGAAIEELGNYLGMAEAPLRIEAIDVSHLDGDNVVASLVVFEDGLPLKRDYRHYSIKHGLGNNDVASIAEVVRRRFSKSEEEGTDFKKTAYKPNLLIVDGGKPQVSAAVAVLTELKIELTVIGLAKRLEEVWPANGSEPLLLPRRSDALFLLQRVRDEAHRFAISHQRKRTRKDAVGSYLDSISGLGPKRKQALLKAFGSVKKLKGASVEEIAAVPGFGPALAQDVWRQLAAIDGGPAVNTATGEIL